MASSWQPSEQGVNTIVSLLAEGQKPGVDQSQIYARLAQCKAFPDFNNYLAFIFSGGEGLPVEVRQTAGLLLKNNLASQYGGLPEPLRAQLRSALLPMLAHPARPLRHTAGTCAVVIALAGGLGAWPELVAALAEGLSSGDVNRAEGALDAMYKMGEDRPMELEARLEGAPPTPGGQPQRASDVLVPRALALFGSPSEDVRALAVGVLNQLSGVMPASLLDALDSYVQGLFSLAHDASPAVRKGVCAGLVQMLIAAPDKLQPSMPALIEYMLQSTQDGDEGVAVESCEFWSAFSESELEPEVLRPFLPRVLPVLLSNMVYEAHDEEVAEAEDLEQRALSGQGAAQEKDEELKPFIHRSSTHGEGGGGGEGAGGEEGGDGEDGDEDEEEQVQWNLRRCSAAGLDTLSTVFGDELLPIILPIVQQRLQQPDWRLRESAILALGAISEGCATGLQPHLPGMVGMLLPTLKDPRPMVRRISCWSLGRYIKWILERAEGGQRGELDAVVAGICERCLDHNRRVQVAACGAVATVVEEAEERIAPYMPAILNTLAATLQQYSRQALRSAYDTIAAVAEVADGRALQDPSNATILLPPLFGKLGSLAEGDRELLPLLECITAVASAAGRSLKPYAEAAFFRCVSMAEQMEAAAASGALDPEEAAEFTVCALDCVSGLAEGLGPSIESLVGRSSLRDLVVRACKDPDHNIRQSGFALVGDLAKSCAPHIKPVAAEIFASIIYNLQPQLISSSTMSACNNAAWSAGELALKCSSEELRPVALQLLERIVLLLQQPAGALPRSLVENAAISLGRVAWMCPEPLAPHVGAFLEPWCAALRGIRDQVEKEHAFLGLCALLQLNPQGAGQGGFSQLCEAVVSWRHIPCEGLRNTLIQLMQGYKQQLEGIGQWDAALATLSPPAQQKLQQMFLVLV